MSSTQPTYEETLAKVASLETALAETKTLYLAKKAEDEMKNDDKDMDASFKKAMKDMDEHTKESTKDMDKVKDAFKRATDETDPEKKKEAMKKAIDEKEEFDQKTSKKGDMHEPAPKDEKKDAKIASLEDKFKAPLTMKILEATKAFDPANFAKIEAELKTASLQEVEAKFATIAPYLGALGIGEQTASIEIPQMVPFQASAVLNSTGKIDIKSASADQIDFSKVKTSDIQGMYS